MLVLLPAADENKTNIKFDYTIAITGNVNCRYWALQLQFLAYVILDLGII